MSGVPTVVDLAINEIVAIKNLGALRQCAIGNGKLAQAIRQSGKFTGNDYYPRAERMVWAIWTGGKLLRAIHAPPGPQSKRSPQVGAISRRQALRDGGLHGAEGWRWIAVGWMPEQDLHAYIGKQKGGTNPLKVSDLVRLGKQKMPVDVSMIGTDYELIHADLIDAEVADESVDCIITDPPYPQEFLPEYGKLSRFAARVLKPGGSCLAMAAAGPVAVRPKNRPKLGQLTEERPFSRVVPQQRVSDAGAVPAPARVAAGPAAPRGAK